MLKILLISITLTFLSANNPKPYSVLGDIIYNNVEKINSLKNLKSYSLDSDKITKYVLDVNDTKTMGFDLEKNKNNVSKREYLLRLRTLSKKNDYFIRGAKNKYKNSMSTNNYILFSEIINCGIIDTKNNKNEIIDYYYKHQEDINESGVVEQFLVEDAKLKALKDAEKKRYKTKKMLAKEKINRLRAKDIREQKELEKRLQIELEQKKIKVREEQKRELAI